jgi:hypothetical protein
MKRMLSALCALSLFYGLPLAPRAAAQTITITVGPATDDSYWVWNEEYQCWLWNGPEFPGDYHGHPYSYWHGSHDGGGDRSHRPGKGEESEAARPVNKGNVEPSKNEQPRVEIEKPQTAQPKAEVEKPKESLPKAQAEKPRTEEKTKAEKPKPEEKKDHSKPKGG